MIIGDRDAVVVPAAVAAWIDTQLGSRRARVRGLDPALDAALVELREVAVAARVRAAVPVPRPSAPGEQLRAHEGEQAAELITTDEAARFLWISVRGVRQAITRGRLPAVMVDGRWHIRRGDLQRYSLERTAA